MSAIPHFSELEASRPSLPELRNHFEAISAQITNASSESACHSALQSWERLRREVDSWRSLTHLRFQQDTTDESYKAEREIADQMEPQLIELEILLKRALLNSPFKESLTEDLGEHVFNLWTW